MAAPEDKVSFRGRLFPEKCGLIVGYAWLIERYSLSVPLPEKLSFISQRHRRYETQGWSILTPRHEPEDTLSGHLTFALRYEGVDLGVLDALFAIINPEILARWVRSEPTGRYSRRIWFLYEWRTGNLLDVPDIIMGNYVEVLDSKLQCVTKTPMPSRRHRINNNFPSDLTSLSKQTATLEDLSMSSSFGRHERLKADIKEMIDLPDHTLDLLIEIIGKNTAPQLNNDQET